MFVRDIGDDGNVEIYRVETMLRQAVRSRFNHRVLGPLPHHLREIILNGGRVGRGGVKPGIHFLPADTRADGGDCADGMPCREQDIFDERAGRRFAIRAGNANDAEIARWKIVERGGEMRERGTGVGNLDNWVIGGLDDFGDWRLGDDGNRAALNRVGDELRAIHIHAGVRDKKRAGNYVLGFVSNARDFKTWDWRLLTSD